MDIGEAYDLVKGLLEKNVPESHTLSDRLSAHIETSNEVGVDYSDLHAFSILPAVECRDHYLQHKCGPGTCNVPKEDCLLAHIGTMFELGVLVGALYHREQSAKLSEIPVVEGGDDD